MSGSEMSPPHNGGPVALCTDIDGIFEETGRATCCDAARRSARRIRTPGQLETD
ncbi:MAG: hypothetical protein GY772_18635 [bacterium]|nr:hypothetical protein [bacterium]